MIGTVALIRKVTARHFRAGGVDVTADQLADQIIPSMRAVTDGRIMSALPPKADIGGTAKLRTQKADIRSRLYPPKRT